MTPVVIAFTPNYFIPAATLVSSILTSGSGEFEFICLVTEEIPERQKRLLKELTGSRARFRYLTPDLEKGVYIDPRYSAAAEFRLLLPELLPGYDRIIYVDCDIIVRNDLSELYNSAEPGDKLLAAVYEAPIGEQAENWKRLGCDSGRYFNSGFLAMNLSLMRKEGTSKKLIGALKTDFLEFPDQDALNMVCIGKVSPLPPYFNAIRTFWLPQYRTEFLSRYSEEDLEEIKTHGNIHYTGGKPWNQFTVEFDKWWRIYYSLPEEVRKEWRPSLKMAILSKLYISRAGKWSIDALRWLYRRLKR